MRVSKFIPFSFHWRSALCRQMQARQNVESILAVIFSLTVRSAVNPSNAYIPFHQYQTPASLLRIIFQLLNPSSPNLLFRLHRIVPLHSTDRTCRFKMNKSISSTYCALQRFGHSRSESATIYFCVIRCWNYRFISPICKIIGLSGNPRKFASVSSSVKPIRALLPA